MGINTDLNQEQGLEPPDLTEPIVTAAAEPQESPASTGDSAFTGEETEVALLGRLFRISGAAKEIVKTGVHNKPAAFKIKKTTEGPAFTTTAKSDDPPIMDPLDNLDPARAQKLSDEADAKLESGADKTYNLNQNIHLNYEVFAGHKGFEKIQQGLAEHLRVQIQKQRRGDPETGVRSDEIRDAMARDLSEDPKFHAWYMTQGPGSTLNDSQVAAGHMMLVASAKELRERAMFMRRHAVGDQLLPAQVAFLEALNVHKQILVKYMGYRAEAGRALRAFQGNSLLGGEGPMRQARMEEIIRTYGAGIDIDTIADRVMSTDHVLGLNQTIRASDKSLSKWGMAASENMVGSILIGGSTATVNFAGNFGMIGRHLWNVGLASRLGKFTTRHEEIEIGEATAHMMGMLMGMRDAGRAFSVSMRTTEPYGGSAKFEGVRDKAITAEALQGRIIKPGNVAGWAVNTYGHIARAAMERILGPTDAWFKVLNERGMWAQLSFRHAMQQARKQDLDNTQFKAILAETLENPDKDMLQRMVEHGEYQTFTNPLEDVGRTVQKLINKSTFGKLIVPVYRTPVQITKVGFLEDTPIGFAFRAYREKMFPKPEPGTEALTPRQIEDAQMAHARMMTGMGIMSWFSMLAYEDRLTGSGPRNSNARLALKESRPPRSMATEFDEHGRPIKWTSFDRFEPFSLQIGLIADIADVIKVSQHMDLDDTQMEWLNTAASAMVVAITENTFNKTYMRSVNDTINSATDPARYLQRWAASMINAQIPMSALRRDMRKTVDPIHRQVAGILEPLQNSMPYLSDDLPPLTFLNGDDKPIEHIFNLPFKEYEIDPTPMIMENGRLWDSVQQVAISLPSEEIGGVKLDGHLKYDLIKISRKGILVNPEDTSDYLVPGYDPDAHYSERVKPAAGGTQYFNFEQFIEHVMRSDIYNDPLTTDFMRVEMLSKVTGKFHLASRKFLMTNNQELADAVMLRKQNQLRRRHGRERADQLMIDRGIEPIEPTGGVNIFRSLF